MKILITGCAGMIGSNLSHWFIEVTDFEIIGVDNLSGGWWANMPVDKRFTFVKMDVGHSFLDTVFLENKPDVVYHAAAYAAENLSPFIRKFNYTNNLVATANVVNCCIKHEVKRLVFFSSIAVYGHGKPPYKETDIPTPNDPYGIAKYACELDIKVAGEQHGLDWCIVRPFNVYGRRQNIKDKYRNVLGIFINQYLSGKPLTIFGDGSQVRCFTNVNDILHPLFNAGVIQQHSKKTYNLGSETPYTVKEAADMLIDVMGGGTIQYMDARHEVHTAMADSKLAQRCLSFYSDKKPFKEGLKEMYEWVLNNHCAIETEAPEYEITKGMYNAWK
jgi:UDP-glucose 4-epimerase